MDPTHPIYRAAFDPVDIVLFCPLQCLFKIPITAVESISMKTNFQHTSSFAVIYEFRAR
jgi:hypothetical protein